jgi:hypothetical protein
VISQDDRERGRNGEKGGERMRERESRRGERGGRLAHLCLWYEVYVELEHVIVEHLCEVSRQLLHACR